MRDDDTLDLRTLDDDVIAPAGALKPGVGGAKMSRPGGVGKTPSLAVPSGANLDDCAAKFEALVPARQAWVLRKSTSEDVRPGVGLDNWLRHLRPVARTLRRYQAIGRRRGAGLDVEWFCIAVDVALCFQKYMMLPPDAMARCWVEMRAQQGVHYLDQRLGAGGSELMSFVEWSRGADDPNGMANLSENAFSIIVGRGPTEDVDAFLHFDPAAFCHQVNIETDNPDAALRAQIMPMAPAKGSRPAGEASPDDKPAVAPSISGGSFSAAPPAAPSPEDEKLFALIATVIGEIEAMLTGQFLSVMQSVNDEGTAYFSTVPVQPGLYAFEIGRKISIDQARFGVEASSLVTEVKKLRDFYRTIPASSAQEWTCRLSSLVSRRAEQYQAFAANVRAVIAALRAGDQTVAEAAAQTLIDAFPNSELPAMNEPVASTEKIASAGVPLSLRTSADACMMDLAPAGYWYNNRCNAQPRPVAQRSTADECVFGDPLSANSSGYWYGNACHETPDPNAATSGKGDADRTSQYVQQGIRGGVQILNGLFQFLNESQANDIRSRQNELTAQSNEAMRNLQAALAQGNSAGAGAAQAQMNQVMQSMMALVASARSASGQSDDTSKGMPAWGWALVATGGVVVLGGALYAFTRPPVGYAPPPMQYAPQPPMQYAPPPQMAPRNNPEPASEATSGVVANVSWDASRGAWKLVLVRDGRTELRAEMKFDFETGTLLDQSAQHARLRELARQFLSGHVDDAETVPIVIRA